MHCGGRHSGTDVDIVPELGGRVSLACRSGHLDRCVLLERHHCALWDQPLPGVACGLDCTRESTSVEHPVDGLHAEVVLKHQC